MPLPGPQGRVASTIAALVIIIAAIELLLMPQRAYGRDPLRHLEGKLWNELEHAGPERNDKWRQYLGVTHDTFHFVVSLVREDMEFGHNYNAGRLYTSSVEERVAVALRHLHTGISFRQLELGTGRAPNTAGKWTRAFVAAMMPHFQDWIYLPADDDLPDISSGFERMRRSRMPGVVGAIDGTHIPFASSNPDFQNAKGFHSIVAQVRRWCGAGASVWDVGYREACMCGRTYIITLNTRVGNRSV